jgi:predicted Rossmann fold flavoprotein
MVVATNPNPRGTAQFGRIMSTAPIVIIGAGASGLMAALWAVARGRPVVILEGSEDAGLKILMSGGGRCNILPATMAPDRFVTGSSPNTLRKILHSWPLDEQRTFFEEDLGLPLAQEPGTGKFFPACDNARRVRDLLVDTARRRGVEIRFGVRAKELQWRKGAWRTTLADGSEVASAAVVLASGGRSFPATGSDGWGFEVARRLGHTVHTTYPALVSLTAQPAVHAHLAGISVEVTLEAPAGRRKTVTSGGFLFTHRGYSGPAVLELSHLAARRRVEGGARQEIFVRWTPMEASAWEALLLRWRGAVEALVARHLPSRLAHALCIEAGVGSTLRTPQLQRDLRLRLLANLTRYPLPWTGDEGYAKAEVTGGGVDLGEVDPRTLESRLRPGLFFCGEILDAFGLIGGYNFQWAWVTGRLAGQASGEPDA